MDAESTELGVKSHSHQLTVINSVKNQKSCTTLYHIVSYLYSGGKNISLNYVVRDF